MLLMHMYLFISCILIIAAYACADYFVVGLILVNDIIAYSFKTDIQPWIKFKFIIIS